MASPVEEVQGSTPAQVARPEVEAGSAEKSPVELPAPEGWRKKLFPKKPGGTPKRDEIVYFSPTGEEIRTRTQLDRYLRSHPGGPAASEFYWSTGGGTPRRSSRLSEKAQADIETPESESKTKPKRSRKSEGESEANEERQKKKRKSSLSEEAAAGKEQDVQDVDHTESLMEEETVTERNVKADDGQKDTEEEEKQEKSGMELDEKVEVSKVEDVEMHETCERAEEREPEIQGEVDVKGEELLVKDPEVHGEDERSAKEPEVQVEGEESSKKPEVQVEGEKVDKEPEAHAAEEKLEKGPEVHVDGHKLGEEPEVCVEKDSLRTPEVHIEEVEKDQAVEVKSEDKQTEQNGTVTKSDIAADLKQQETVAADIDNGLDEASLNDNSTQNKPLETLGNASAEWNEKHFSQEAEKPQEVLSSHNAEVQQPSEPLGESS